MVGRCNILAQELHHLQIRGVQIYLVTYNTHTIKQFINKIFTHIFPLSNRYASNLWFWATLMGENRKYSTLSPNQFYNFWWSSTVFITIKNMMSTLTKYLTQMNMEGWAFCGSWNNAEQLDNLLLLWIGANGRWHPATMEESEISLLIHRFFYRYFLWVESPSHDLS